MVHEALVLYLPERPITSWVSRRDRALPVGNRIRGIGDVFAKASFPLHRIERQRAVFVEIEVRRLRLPRRPRVVRVPGIRAGLKSLRVPFEGLPVPMQPITEPRRFDVLAEF